MCRISMLIALLFIFVFHLDAQPISVNGNLAPLEGSTERYELRGNIPPGNYTATVSNGAITASNLTPGANPMFLEIRWSFLQSTGEIRIYSGRTLLTLIRVQILSFESQDFCQTAQPLMQDVGYGLVGNQISVSNCRLVNFWGYSIMYEWESADLTDLSAPSPWTLVNHQQQASIDPLPMFNYGISGYRRTMKFIDPQSGIVLRTVVSTTASVRFTGPFLAGTILDMQSDPSDPSLPIMVNYQYQPRITQVPASGGLCYNYTYSWEISISNGPWENIGNGVDFPITAYMITAACRIRRKVICGAVEAYSNTVFYLLNYISPNLENRNYLRVNTITRNGIYGWEEADQLTSNEKSEVTIYYDGLGRQIQQIEKEKSSFANGLWCDQVNIAEYDTRGLREKTFLQYPSTLDIGKFKTNALTEQANFIHHEYGENNNAPTYAGTTFSNDPLSKLMVMKSAGEGWGGSPAYGGISFRSEWNLAAENIRVWTIGFEEQDMPMSYALYPSGSLAKTVIKDEKDREIICYYDRDGKIILKKLQATDDPNILAQQDHTGWLCTYYVYDDLAQLRCEISPKAVAYLNANNWILPREIYDELCFYKNYDERGRLILSHAPGRGNIEMIYDRKNRLVLMQDANQCARNEKQWSFYLYDNLDRPRITGLFDHDGSRQSFASFVNTLDNGPLDVNFFTGSNETFTLDNPVAGNPVLCDHCANTTVNTVEYFDNYENAGTMNFNPSFAFLPSAAAYIDDPSPSLKVLGMSTGTKKRVIDKADDDHDISNDKFTSSNIFYDEKGRQLQTKEDEGLYGYRETSYQYDFSGKTMGTCLSHTMPGSAFTNYIIKTAFEYDRCGRLLSITKSFNGNPSKKIAAYSYDNSGRLKTRALSPGFYGSRPLETLNYDYNIQGWLTGINKDYVRPNTALNQWDHFFGQSLGYENKDVFFASKEFNGSLAGMAWKTQGDNIARKYDYAYDPVNRLNVANYTQRNHPAQNTWNNQDADFSVTKMNYDENNNLLQMDQKGMLPGTAAAVYIDKLQYKYRQVNGDTWSNNLSGIFDGSPDMPQSTNGIAGDFKDEHYGVDEEDYNYDAAGNLISDRNEGILPVAGGGMEYNFLGKVKKISIQGGNTLQYIYNASGKKLAMEMTSPDGRTVSNFYSGDFLYEKNNGELRLAMILHEEGRVRVYDPINNPRLIIGNNFDMPGNAKGVFEYFIRDNLQNLRSVITEELHQEIDDCSMETTDPSVQNYENALFGQNELNATRRDKTGVAPGWSGNSSAKVSMLKEGVQSLGPNMLLKVMAGDHVSASAQYYWLGTPDNSPGGLNLLGNIVAGMMNAISNGSVAGSIKGSATAIGNQYTQNPGGLGALINQYNDPLSDRPLAFLNILFLDENFNLVPFDPVTQLGSFSIQVGNSGDGQPPIIASQIRVPRNGYAYVYLTNNSRTAVYFDNFRIVHDRGRLVEENAYYPYGLKIKSLCAKAFDKGENKYGYQSCFSEEEMQTGWNEFNYRMYNPKTGVWNSPDPMDEFAGPYSSMGSNPSIFTDPSGGSINELLGNALNENFLGTAVGALVGTTVGIITAGQSPGKKFSNGAVGFFAGAIMGNLVQSNGFDIWEAAVDIAPMASNATGSGSPGLHSVWVISNTWNDAYIQKFNASVSVYMSQFENAAQTFTCDDLALELIIQFAKDNHLPFKWEVAEMTYDANATSLANFETFLLHVKIHSGAPDFQRASNTNTINQDAVNGGSMILNEGSRLVAHHVQVVTSVYRDMGMVRGINVRQGNFRSPVWIWNRFTGSDDPRSWRYLGVTPQMGYYNTELDIFRNMTLNRTTMDFSKIEHLVYIQFNFQRWNK